MCLNLIDQISDSAKARLAERIALSVLERPHVSCEKCGMIFMYGGWHDCPKRKEKSMQEKSMDVSHVPAFDIGLKWSEPDTKDVIMAAGPNEGEFYFVQDDLDSTWAGIICGERAWSRMVDGVESGKQLCFDDLKDRLVKNTGRTRFAEL